MKTKKEFKKLAAPIAAAIKKIIKEEDENYYSRKIDKTLRSLGFRQKHGIDSSEGHAFFNKKIGLVAKRSYICGPIPKKAAPSIVIDDLWLIQPIVINSGPEFEKKVKELEDKNRKQNGDLKYDNLERLYGEDYKEDNVGLWCGKLVAIDW